MSDSILLVHVKPKRAIQFHQPHTDSTGTPRRLAKDVSPVIQSREAINPDPTQDGKLVMMCLKPKSLLALVHTLPKYRSISAGFQAGNTTEQEIAGGHETMLVPAPI